MGDYELARLASEDYLASALAKFRPWEVDGQSPQRDFVRAAAFTRFRVFRGGNQSGKDQPTDEPVWTPAGWRPIGSLAVGDVVFSEDGTPTAVTGVFPQGRRLVARVAFDDGSWTRCGLKHLWKVRTREARFPRDGGDLGAWQILPLDEIRRRWGDRPKPVQRCSIPVAGPVVGAEAALPIDPYVLGVLLGDGCLRSAVRFTSADPWIVDRVAARLPAGCSVRAVTGAPIEHSIVGHRGPHDEWSVNPILAALGLMGLRGKLAHEKHVPHAYLTASVSQRIELLRGLMDTDGSCSAAGDVEFSSTSSRLAEAVSLLVWSLGGKATTSQRITNYTYKGELLDGRPSLRVRVRLPGVCPFSLPRKAERCLVRLARTGERIVTSVDADGEAETICISVAHPSGTYLTRDMIVTHNTTIGAVDVAGYAQGWHPCARHQPPVMIWASAISWEMGVGQVMWPALKPWIEKKNIAKVTWHKHGAIEVPFTILLKNGSTIQFKSQEQGRRMYQGAPIHYGWVDEEHDEDIIEEFMARLLKHRAMFSVTLTPIMRRLWVQKLEKRAGTFVARASTVMAARSGALADGDVASVQEYFSGLPDQMRRVRESGDYVSLHGVVYPDFDRDVHVLRPEAGQLVGGKDEPVREWPIPAHWPRVAAIDFGVNVPTAVPIGAVDERNNTLIVYRTFYATHIRASKWAQILRWSEVTWRGWKEKALPVLSQAPLADHDMQARLEFSAAGIATSPAKKDKDRGIEAVARALAGRGNGLKLRFVVDPTPAAPVHDQLGRCDAFWLVWELEAYHYKRRDPDKPDGKDEPVKKDDHAVDALRYLVVDIERRWRESPGYAAGTASTFVPVRRRLDGLLPDNEDRSFGG